MKILAAADLHMGRRSTGLTGDMESLATKYAWLRLVQWAIDNNVDAVALAGDVVDQSNGFFESIGPLQTGFQRLGEAGIEVFLVTGNHDHKVLPASVDTQYKHVHLLGPNGQWGVESLTRNGETVQFVGWSYPTFTSSVKVSPLPLLGTVQLDVNFPVIGLLHADLDPVKESNYCPVWQRDLVGVGVGTWILGHIHKPGSWDLPGTTIHYPGSLQALSAKESGAHGFLLLTVDAGRIKIDRIPFSTVRYGGLDIDVTGADTQEDVWRILTEAVMADARDRLYELEGVRFLSYDLMLTGAHKDEPLVVKWAVDSKRDTAIPIGKTTITIRSVDSVIRPVVGDLAELAKEPSPAGSLASVIMAIRTGGNTPLLTALEQQWEQQQRQLQSSGVYQPLLGTTLLVDTRGSARDHLLRECNRLLNELLSQIQKSN